MFSVMFVCLSVCVSVWVSICLSICVSICSGFNFWTASHRDFNFGMRYIFTISRSRSFCQSQGHMRRNDNFTYCNMLILYRSLIKSRSHIKVKVTSRSNIYILYEARTLCKRVVCIQLNAFMFPFHTKYSGTVAVDIGLFWWLYDKCFFFSECYIFNSKC